MLRLRTLTWYNKIMITAVIIILILVIIFSIYVALRNKSRREGMSNNVNQYIDIIYYINLDHRTDRKEGFLQEIAKLDLPEDKVVRIEAVYKKGQGSLGCSMSHIKAMEAFVESNHQTCIIFEDDFGFSEDIEQINRSFQQLFENKPDFDVCMLAGWDQETSAIEGHDYIKKVERALTTSGYIVNRKFASTLLQNFRDGCKILEQRFNDGNGTYATEYKYEVDEYWTQLQPGNKWYIFNPKLGKQRDTYSDIREREKIKEYDF